MKKRFCVMIEPGCLFIDILGYGLNFINRSKYPELYSSGQNKVYKKLVLGWHVKVIKP